MEYGEMAYWHSHPELGRLAQEMRDKIEREGISSHQCVDRWLTRK